MNSLKFKVLVEYLELKHLMMSNNTLEKFLPKSIKTRAAKEEDIKYGKKRVKPLDYAENEQNNFPTIPTSTATSVPTMEQIPDFQRLFKDF